MRVKSPLLSTSWWNYLSDWRSGLTFGAVPVARNWYHPLLNLRPLLCLSRLPNSLNPCRLRAFTFPPPNASTVSCIISVCTVGVRVIWSQSVR